MLREPCPAAIPPRPSCEPARCCSQSRLLCDSTAPGWACSTWPAFICHLREQVPERRAKGGLGESLAVARVSPRAGGHGRSVCSACPAAREEFPTAGLCSPAVPGAVGARSKAPAPKPLCGPLLASRDGPNRPGQVTLSPSSSKLPCGKAKHGSTPRFSGAMGSGRPHCSFQDPPGTLWLCSPSCPPQSQPSCGTLRRQAGASRAPGAAEPGKSRALAPLPAEDADPVFSFSCSSQLLAPALDSIPGAAQQKSIKSIYYQLAEIQITGRARMHTSHKM